MTDAEKFKELYVFHAKQETFRLIRTYGQLVSVKFSERNMLAISEYIKEVLMPLELLCNYFNRTGFIK